MWRSTIKHIKSPPIKFYQYCENVTSFSGTKTTSCYIAKPSNAGECQELIQYAKQFGYTICPKGAGYSYADMILNDGHIICDFSNMYQLIDWNPDSGMMVVEPGFGLNKVLYIGLISNWVLSACPGGMAITIGGALSNNVHGKDSWKYGNFGDQVVQFKLIISNGELVTVTRANNPELFNSVIGGMGLLGLLVEISIQLKKVESPFVEVTTNATPNISSTLSVLEKSRSDSDFSIAWVDAFAKGNSVGRGFVTRAKWTGCSNHVNKKNLKKSLEKSTKIFDLFPSKITWKLLKPFFRPWAIRIANQINYHRKHRLGDISYITTFPLYNFMHNKIPDLESVYEPEGFYEFEPLIPISDAKNGLETLLKLGHRFSSESMLCGIKMHRGDDYRLSYSLDGYSIGIDIQRKGRTKKEISNYSSAIFKYTCDLGGKIYLSKDELLSKKYFSRMYGGRDEFIHIKNKYDSIGLFQSDMYRRLFF